MQKNEAALFLDYYLDEQVESEFAVMLDGPWGAGKTHFIKKYLDDRASNKNSSGKLIHLYASLYGITSTSEITDQFFAQTHPILNSKASRLLGAIASKGLNGFIGTDVNSTKENRSILQDMVLKLNDKVLIFDDLERCSMNIGDVLGFINTFVEHEGLKVIILANEADIPEGQISTYNQQKEKLVGKTIRVKSDPEEVLEKLTERLINSSVRQIVINEKSALLNTFMASEKTNYRNLRASLCEFERVVIALDSILQNSSDGMKQLLLYMVATGHEYRSGDLDVKTLRSLPTSQHYVMREDRDSGKSHEVNAFEKLKKRYVDVKWTDPIISPAHLADIFQSGFIDVSSLNTALTQHPVIVGYSKAPTWRQLWGWMDLSKAQYFEVRRQLLEQLSNYEIIEPGQILHIASSILVLNEYGDLILGDDEQVVNYFNTYLEELTDRGTLIPDRKLFEFTLMGYGGLGYGSQVSKSFKTILSSLENATQLACRKKMKKISETYIQRLKSDEDAYNSLHKFGFEDSNYADIAFLHNLDVTEFSQLLIIDSSSNDRLFANLTHRYQNERHHSFRLNDEYQWLGKLNDELKSTLKSISAPHKELLSIRINYYFDLINKSISTNN